MTQRVDISIGPVQGFVAQSRRTRDLWGSSYLLSFLAGHAMRGAVEGGGQIIRPVVGDDQLYLWINGCRDGEAPRIGSLPNRFAVKTDGAAKDVADGATKAIMVAWERVCEAVWEKYVKHAASNGNGTEVIWKRQIGSFWEVAWTASEAGARDRLLPRRKHWRSHRPPDEPGDKCSVMHDFQELSGFVRPRSSDERLRQDEFWDRVRGRLGPLDLRDNERLCAIALVKRLFPKVARKALGWNVDMSHWPSTVYVGALPWIKKVASTVPTQARKYAETVKLNAAGTLAEHQPKFAGINTPDVGDFFKLDANYFHCSFVRDKRLCPLPEGAVRDDLDRMLKSISDANDDSGRPFGQPTAYYALMLADGDRLGRLVEKLGGKRAGSALADFTRGAPEIVQGHDGVTVYAGGDDVLAMIPVPKALSCAATLAKRYKSSFGGQEPGATLSAAIVFAHVRLPLAEAIAEAHRLLDDIAKDENGRDSLVAGVLKPGGLNCQWVTTWERANEIGGSPCADMLIGDLAERLRVDAAEPGISSALIYRIRVSLTVLSECDEWKPGAWISLPKNFDLHALLRAEIYQSLSKRLESSAGVRAKELADVVLSAMGRSRAEVNADGTELLEFGVDALLLARFLADPSHDGASG